MSPEERLAELGIAWEYVNKGLVARRPIVCVGQNWVSTIASVSRYQPEASDYIVVLDDIKAIVENMSEQAICTEMNI